MAKSLITLVLLCDSLSARVTELTGATADDEGNPGASSAQVVNSVIEWNRTLLVIVRTPSAQPPTIHSTRSFAILHATVYDAINNIDGTFSPYLVPLPDVPRHASQPAAADQAAHDVLVALYPAFQATLDAELQQDLAQIPDGQNKADGITVGQTVAAQILSLRSNDGSGVTPPSIHSGKGAWRLPTDTTQFRSSGFHAMASGHSVRPGACRRISSRPAA